MTFKEARKQARELAKENGYKEFRKITQRYYGQKWNMIEK